MIYKDLIHQNVVGYLFLLLSGVVVSRRVWLEQARTPLVAEAAARSDSSTRRSPLMIPERVR
jgi:hypothetical protein